MIPSNTPGKLVLFMGPSGVGKSVILKELRRKHLEFTFPKSATTRKRRRGEGDDLYYFVNEDAFDALVADGKVLEWAVVHGDARYGTLVEEILPPIQSGKTVVREVDVQGFDSIRTHHHFRNPDAPYRLQSVFIMPENRAQLIARITKRAPISAEELERRIASMDRELTYARLCDAQVVNHEGRIAETIAEVEKVIAG